VVEHLGGYRGVALRVPETWPSDEVEAAKLGADVLIPIPPRIVELLSAEDPARLSVDASWTVGELAERGGAGAPPALLLLAD